MKGRKFLHSALGGALLMAVSIQAHSAPYSSTYDGNIGTENPPGFRFNEVNEGESYSVTLVFDNGASTTADQTWNESHLTCVIFAVNDARNVQFAHDLSSATYDEAVGTIVTNGSGELTGMFSDLATDSADSDSYVSSGFNPLASVNWYLNETNDVFYSEDFLLSFGDAAGGVLMSPPDWSNPEEFEGTCDVQPTPPPAPVPSLSQWGLLIMAGILMLFGVGQLRRRT